MSRGQDLSLRGVVGDQKQNELRGKQSEELLGVLNRTLEELNRLEPAQNEVFGSLVNEQRVTYEQNDFSLSSHHTTMMIGVRSIINGRLGFATTNSTRPEALKQVCQEAQLVARLSPPSENHRLSTTAATSHNGVCDQRLMQISPKDLFSYAQLVVDTARSDARVSVDRAEMGVAQQDWAILNSNGVERSASATSASWSVMGMAKTSTEVTSFDFDGGATADETKVTDGVHHHIGLFRDSVIGSLGVQRGSTYKGAVLLHPYAVMDLLGSFVATNCSGLRHQDGMSSWKGKLGETVGSSLLSVVEDPCDKTRIEGWMPFDREGVSTARHELLRAGVLNFVAHNCFSAYREKLTSTGNATGGSRSLPGLGFSNLTVQGASSSGGMEQIRSSADGLTDVLSDEKIFQKFGQGLMLKRFSGNEDPVSGQFSGVAKNSLWIRGGERAFPIHEVMISGNLFEILKNVLAVGSTLHDIAGGGRAPYVVVDGISVTAG